jgi:release factor glutamine methyltransferase
MNIGELLEINAQKLKSINIKNPLFEAEILLSDILGESRECIITHPERKLTKFQINKFVSIIKKRLKGIPIAYLVGYKYFFGNRFFVTNDVLVPRPETELMVDEINNFVLRNSQPINLVDVGTGSGNIIISLAKILKNKRNKYFALDISKKALIIAKKNAILNKIRNKIIFIRGSLIEPLSKLKLAETKYQTIIAANLPYGWKEWKNNCSMDTKGLKFEPKIALYTKEKGLKLYREMFRQIQKIRVPNISFHIFCEIDHRQASIIKKMIKQELPQAKIKVKKDLMGLDRLIIIELK